MSILPVMAAMLALVASVAVGVHVEPAPGQGSGVGSAEDLQHNVEAVEDSSLTTSTFNSLENWGSQVEGMPMEGKVGKLRMQYNGGTRWVTVGGYYSSDKRDSSSFYASAISSSGMAVSLVAHLPDDPWKEFFKLEIVKNPTSVGSKTDGWFLAVHDHVPDDRKYIDSNAPTYRVIAHQDPKMAVSWTWEGDRLKVHHNEQAPYTGGYYLCAPPGSRRDSTSDYIAVCPRNSADASMDYD